MSFSGILARLSVHLTQPRPFRLLKEIAIGLSVTLPLHGAYVYFTKSDDGGDNKITVKEKYVLPGGPTPNIGTTLMIIDDKNRHYALPNSLWFNHWSAPELWSSLKIDHHYHVRQYGVRCGILGLFPNIVATKDNTLHQQ
jgi:hypothetical protein